MEIKKRWSLLDLLSSDLIIPEEMRDPFDGPLCRTCYKLERCNSCIAKVNEYIENHDLPTVSIPSKEMVLYIDNTQSPLYIDKEDRICPKCNENILESKGQLWFCNQCEVYLMLYFGSIILELPGDFFSKSLLDDLENHLEKKREVPPLKNKELWEAWKEKLRELVESCKKITQEQPNNERAWILLGNSYQWTKSPEERISGQIECDKKVLEINPLNKHVWQDLGYIFWQSLEQAEDAIICFRKVLDLDPENDLVWNALGVIYDELVGDEDEALKCFEKYLELTDETLDFICWEIIGRLYFSKENYKRAAECFEEAINDGSLNEGNDWVLEDLCESYERLGKWQNALEVCYRRTKEEPQDELAQEILLRYKLK